MTTHHVSTAAVRGRCGEVSKRSAPQEGKEAPLSVRLLVQPDVVKLSDDEDHALPFALRFWACSFRVAQQQFSGQ